MKAFWSDKYTPLGSALFKRWILFDSKQYYTFIIFRLIWIKLSKYLYQYFQEFSLNQVDPSGSQSNHNVTKKLNPVQMP